MCIEEASNKKINCSYGKFNSIKTTSYKVLQINTPPWQNKIENKDFKVLIQEMITNYESKK